MIELNNALGHIEWMMIGQGHDTGAQFDTMATLACCSQKHLWRRNHFPTGRMVFATPKLVKTQFVELLNQIQITLKLQHGVFANGMVGGKEGAEFQSIHG